VRGNKLAFAQAGQAPFEIILPLPTLGKLAGKNFRICPNWANPLFMQKTETARYIYQKKVSFH